jgi:demethylmenaquinone methyltransferase/2-methoxy-6-polyprenyl-1,4-benzoquinol methylase
MKLEMERVLRPRKQARQSYNAMSRWYDLFTGSEKRFTDIGIQMLDIQTGESVLEIGCGTGHALSGFAKRGGIITAIDISDGMLDVARRQTKNKTVGFCQADGLSLPFPKGQFDAAFTSFTLELFDTPDIPLVLKECHRVLKVGGRIGIVSLAKQETTAVRVYEWFHRQCQHLWTVVRSTCSPF